MEIKDSTFDMNTKESIFKIFASYIESNPALAMASILLMLIFLYIMALYEKLGLFHYLGVILSLSFMFWVSMSDDARTGLKLTSIGVIFMIVIIFLSI